MSEKDRQYESYKNYLRSLNLSWEEYEAKLSNWCKKHKY